MKTYDPHCFDLAFMFLQDEPLLIGREALLAAHIQAEIEEWIEGERSLRERLRQPAYLGTASTE